MAGVPVERLEALVEEAKRRPRKPSEYVRRQLEVLDQWTNRGMSLQEQLQVASIVAHLAETLASLERKGD